MAEQISEMLTDIFNRSLESGQVPEDWRVVNVTTLFKKGFREELEECFLGKNRCLPPCVHSNYTYCDTYSKNNHPIFINANQCNFEA